MLQMDHLVVIVALPNLQQDQSKAVVGTKCLCRCLRRISPIKGRLGDMIGQIRALELELIVSIATSQMGGFASSPGVLIIARIFQGMRAALADPVYWRLRT